MISSCLFTFFSCLFTFVSCLFTDVEVVVRDLNNKPIDDITVLLVTETEVRHMNVTTFMGRTEFHDLCYGQDALITVNGASFDNEHCQDKKVPIVVGQAKSYTVKVDC